MSQEKIKNTIEAALMVSEQPLTVTHILNLFQLDQCLHPKREHIHTALEQLKQDYEGRGIELTEVASGFRFQIRTDYSSYINQLFDERPPRYSRALLETLAIIAYRQPITRAEIEDIRGVSVSSNIIKTLQEREWIKGVGHRDVPGKPELLATTKQFLDYFNLKKLSDLPALADIKDFDSINPDLFDALESDKQTETNNTDQIETGPDITNHEQISSENETDTKQNIKDESNPVTLAIPESDEKTISENTTTQEPVKIIPFKN